MIEFDVGELLDRVEPTLRRRYMAAMARLRARNDLHDIQRLVDQRRYDEAIAGLDEAAEEVSGEFAVAYLLVARAVAERIRAASPAGFSFDVTHARTQAIIRGMERDLVRMLRADARRAISDSLVAGRGTVARDLLDGLGLGQDQARALRVFHASHNMGPPDKRAPRTTVERMASGIRQNYRAAQAIRVGLWLGQIAAEVAADDALRQGVEFGALRRNDIVRRWRTRRDDAVRDSHTPMEGQERALEESFVSGAGNVLHYPGDPQAPDKETRGCRCGLEIVIRG